MTKRGTKRISGAMIDRTNRLEIAWLAVLAGALDVHSLRELAERFDTDRESITKMRDVAQSLDQLDLNGLHPAVSGWAKARTSYNEQILGKVSKRVLDGSSTARNKNTKAAMVAREAQKAKAAAVEAQKAVQERDQLAAELRRMKAEQKSRKAAELREQRKQQQIEANGTDCQVTVEKRQRA